MFQHTFIGLDVHAVSVVGCALNPDTGELVRMQMDSDPAVVLDWVRRFEPPVKAVYESGPTERVTWLVVSPHDEQKVLCCFVPIPGLYADVVS